MLGYDLAGTIAEDVAVREAGLFGNFGRHVNVTDGRYAYYRAPVGDNQPLYAYTNQTIRLRRDLLAGRQLPSMELVPPLSFSKGMPVLKTAMRGPTRIHQFDTFLFDLQEDPGEVRNLWDSEAHIELKASLVMALLQAEMGKEPVWMPRVAVA